MKKTLFIALFTAALVGGQVFATEVILTKLDGGHETGSYSYSGMWTSGSVEAKDAVVTIFQDNDGSNYSNYTVYGGWATNDSANNNKVTMTGGQVYAVYGGKAGDSGNATGNTVTMSDGQVGNVVSGGFVDGSGDANGNTVTIAGGSMKNDVYGGYVQDTGDANGNTVTMTGGEVDVDVYGGFVYGSGDATGNSLTMTGGQVGRDVYGGYTYSGEASGNSVTMDNGEITSMLFGGYSNNDGDASSNTVIVNGGYVHSDVCGGYAKSGSASNNTLTMAGRTDGDVYAGKAGNGSASGNSVNMSGGSAQTVAGGIAMKDNATGNTANMSGGSAHIVVGGCAEVGNADGNTAIMTGGVVRLLVGAEAIAGNATGNTAIMAGGQVTSDVYGGAASDGGNATDNTVHLVGEGASYTVGDTTYQGSKIAIQRSVHGVYVEAGWVSSNNSVHIHGTGASIGGTIDSCQRLNFHIVQGQAGAQGTPMVTLGGALDLTSVELGFNGDAVTNWAAFNGKSITLVSMTSETITGLVPPTDPVDITDEGGKTVATATLTLLDDQMLSLTNIQGVTPVPTVGPDALDVTLVNSLWASSAYVREFVRLSEAQGYSLKEGDTAVWGGGFGTFMHATGNRGFKSDGGGYGIGVNHAFSANTQAGISLGQGFGSYHNSGEDGATVHQRAILAAATASTRIGKNLSLGGHLAFGNVRNRADCRLEGESGRARWNDNVFNLGAQAAYDFHVTEATAITPFLGLDWAYGAQESVNGAYDRHYSHGRLNELRMPVGVTVSTSAEVGSTKLLPQLSVAYVPSLAQQVPHANVSDNGQGYRVKGYAPGRNAFMLNVGVNAVFSDSWSAGAFYTLETRRHCVDQSANASVRYTF